MLPLGVKTFVALNQAIQYNVGVPWEYIRIRNESDNECIVTISGSGSTPIAAWVQDDIYVGNQFTGQITIVPIATTTTTTLQAGFVNGTAYARGELKNPGSIMLVRIVAVTPIQAQTLSNEGNALGATVIDIGTPQIANLWTIFNDHFLIYVQQGGVRHQVLAGNITGLPPLQIGAAGDTVEFLGNPTVDQALIVTGNTTLNALTTINANIVVNGLSTLDSGAITTNGTGQITIPNNQALNIKNALGTAKIAMFVNTLDHLILQENDATGQILFRDVNNNIICTVGAGSNFAINLGDLNLTNKKINDNAGHNILDATATGLFLKGNASTSGPFNYQGDGSHTDWIMGSFATGGGTSANGAAVITHGLKQLNVAATPTAVMITPTQTPTLFWVTAIGATTFTINATSVFTFNFVVLRNAL